MTVGDNVAYGLVVRKVAKANASDAGRPKRCGWSASRATSGASPTQLSGGQRQRVALARALVNRPRVLLLDEPLGALDLKLREEMQIELKAIQQQVGITFIYVTHDQEEALTMSDRLAVFNNGPDRAARGAGRGLRAARDAVRGRASSGTSNLLTGDAAQQILGRGRHVHHPTGEDPTWPTPDAVAGADEIGARGTHPGRSSISARIRATRRARAGLRARRHPAEPGDDLDRGARPGGQGCPPHLEATARAPRRGRRATWRRRTRHDESARFLALAAVTALAIGRVQRQRRVAPRPACRRRSATARASSTSSSGPGYAERGERRPGLRLGHPVRDGDRLQGQHDRDDRLEQRRLAHAVGRLRRRVVLRRRDDPARWPAASSPRSTPR